MVLSPAPAMAAPVYAPHLAVELVPETYTLQPGATLTVGLRLDPDEGWHTYWQNPGDSGLATRLRWDLPAGFEARPMEWPWPKRFEYPPYVSYGYDGEVLLLTEIAVPGDLEPGQVLSLRALAEWTVCREDRCVPGRADLSLDMPVSGLDADADPLRAPMFATARARLPSSAEGWTVAAIADGDELLVSVVPPSGISLSDQGLLLFPIEKGILSNAAPQRSYRRSGAVELRLQRADGAVDPPPEFEAVIVVPGGFGGGDLAGALYASIPVSRGTPPEGSSVGAVAGSRGSPGLASSGGTAAGPAEMTLLLSLSFAFIGGLILNLMPCVFPVLSLKVLGFVSMGGENRSVVRRHGLVFAAGVIVSFWLLAGVLLLLRAAGERLGWGFQLQSPAFVAVVTLLLFALALNLFGVFELGARFGAAAGRFEGASGYWGSFLSGALATVLATPCTAPFMGTAVGYAVQQTSAQAMAVFGMLGAGMAFPYVLLSSSPALLRRLPRPGPWMETFKQLMAFPLLAAVVWLTWVFGSQTGNSGVVRLLSALLLVSVAGWLRGRAATVSVLKGSVALLAVIASLAVAMEGASISAPATGLTRSADDSGIAWERYESARLAELRRAGLPVFIDFTADWCLTCKVNEKVTFSSGQVQRKFKELGVYAMKADWTSGDPSITRALEAFGRSGVPLYVLYHGDENTEPAILPQVLNPGIVLAALEKIETPG